MELRSVGRAAIRKVLDVLAEGYWVLVIYNEVVVCPNLKIDILENCGALSVTGDDADMIERASVVVIDRVARDGVRSAVFGSHAAFTERAVMEIDLVRFSVFALTVIDGLFKRGFAAVGDAFIVHGGDRPF